MLHTATTHDFSYQQTTKRLLLAFATTAAALSAQKCVPEDPQPALGMTRTHEVISQKQPVAYYLGDKKVRL